MARNPPFSSTRGDEANVSMIASFHPSHGRHILPTTIQAVEAFVPGAIKTRVASLRAIIPYLGLIPFPRWASGNLKSDQGAARRGTFYGKNPVFERKIWLVFI